MTTFITGAEMTNLIAALRARHYTRTFNAPWHSWRPRPQTMALTVGLGGICIVKHGPLWQHGMVHVGHGSEIRHARARCFFWWHYLPGEQFLRRALRWVRGEWRWGIRRVQWRIRKWASSV